MAYQQLANVYDAFMADAPYEVFLNFTMDVFAKHGQRISTIADLGCGTGEMAIRLAEKGLNVQAVDYSEEMLSVAQQKAAEKKGQIQFLHQDLRTLEGLQNLDAAVSYFDVINYIVSPDHLMEVFRNVAASLKNGGLFLFDIHSVDNIENAYAGETFSVVTDDLSYIWFCESGEEPGEVYHDLTFFVRDGLRYERFDEYHHQHTYSISFYEELLRQAGFKKIIWYAGPALELENADETAPRIFILAIK